MQIRHVICERENELKSTNFCQLLIMALSIPKYLVTMMASTVYEQEINLSEDHRRTNSVRITIDDFALAVYFLIFVTC